jgi:hypothetical protein
MSYVLRRLHILGMISKRRQIMTEFVPDIFAFPLMQANFKTTYSPGSYTSRVHVIQNASAGT